MLLFVLWLRAQHISLLGLQFFWSSLEGNSWSSGQNTSLLSWLWERSHISESHKLDPCPRGPATRFTYLFVFPYLALCTCKLGGLLLVPWSATAFAYFRWKTIRWQPAVCFVIQSIYIEAKCKCFRWFHWVLSHFKTIFFYSFRLG